MKTITNEMITDFKEHLQNEEKSSSTIEKYIHDVACFKTKHEGCELTKSAVLEYKSNLVETYKTASVNSMLAAVNKFFRENGWYDCPENMSGFLKILFALHNQRHNYSNRNKW